MKRPYIKVFKLNGPPEYEGEENSGGYGTGYRCKVYDPGDKIIYQSEIFPDPTSASEAGNGFLYLRGDWAGEAHDK